MKNRLTQWLRSDQPTPGGQEYPEVSRSCTGRILSALTFIVIIICLGLWITAFLLLKDRFFTDTLSGNLLTNLTCLTFFGGLVIALFIGGLAGNFLRREFWKMLLRQRK
jgi:hypothetical protein